MILADKIIALRKKEGWSQEELAHQLEVSRQAVSKWESGASVPDLDKILKLSQIFGVSTDYLLQESMEEMPAGVAAMTKEEEWERSVSLEEVNRYLAERPPYARKMAFAIMSYVLSPILLILLAGFQDAGRLPMTENAAAGTGLIVLLLIVAAATMAVILSTMKLQKFEYLEKENFHLEYGGEGLVRKRREEYEETHRKGIAIGVGLCILAVLPIFGAMIFGGTDLDFIICVCVLLAVISIAVHLFVRVGITWDTFSILLEEEDHTREMKEMEKSMFPTIYWCLVAALYLGISFWTNAWERTWILWPCAGCLFAALQGILCAWRRKQKNN